MLIGALVGVVLIALLFRWAHAISSAYGAPRWIRFLPIASAILFALCFSAAFQGLTRVFRAPADADPAMKARVLAESISEAMHLLLASGVVLVISAVVLLVLTWRYRWSQKVPKPEGDPPYR
jgi:hypothetical protein